MDKQLLFPNSLNSDYKLTRAASFSELSTTKKVVYEQQYQSEASGNLFKQYSCEQIFDHKSNASHFKVSRTLKSDDKEQIDIWKTTIPTHSSLTNSEYSKNINQPYLNKQYSSPNEYLFKDSDNINSRKIITPPTLILENNRFKQSDIYNQKSLQNYEQPNNKKLNESIFQFKKPSLPIKKSNNLRNDYNFRDEKANDHNIVTDYNLSEQINKNIYNNLNRRKVNTSELKTKLRPLIVKKPETKKDSYFCWSRLFIILILVATAYLAFLFKNAELSTGFCNPRFKSHRIPEDLKNHIHGQDTAINDLIKYFKKRENQTGFDVLGLIGTTGIGKSYTAEIIKNNVIDTYNVLDLFPPFHEKETLSYTSLSVCQCNLIRLENIKTDEILNAVKFIDKLNKRVDNYCILILALFNTQETDHNLKKNLDVNKSLFTINEKFEEIGLQPTLVSFTTMNNESLIKCIKDAADYANIELTNDDIEYVKNDLLRADSGCKGAHAKVQVVGKIKD